MPIGTRSNPRKTGRTPSTSIANVLRDEAIRILGELALDPESTLGTEHLAKVALAKVEERWSALEAKHRQSQDDLDRRRQERAQGEQRLTGARLRLEQSQRTMLHASAALAHGYLDKEAAERRVAELARERDQLHRERQQLAVQLVRPCGTLAVVGMHTAPHFAFSPLDAYNLNLTYKTGRDIQLVLGLVQMLWDRTEPDGYAPYIATNMLPGTPKHDILIHAAIGSAATSFPSPMR